MAPGVVVAYERNVQTNARLQDAGIEVLTIAGSELGTGRGGPRCMSCPAARDPSLRRVQPRFRAPSRLGSYRQLGSQISMFQVCCEIGRPVSTGNSHAKFVTTRAT